MWSCWSTGMKFRTTKISNSSVGLGGNSVKFCTSENFLLYGIWFTRSLTIKLHVALSMVVLCMLGWHQLEACWLLSDSFWWSGLPYVCIGSSIGRCSSKGVYWIELCTQCVRKIPTTPTFAWKPRPFCSLRFLDDLTFTLAPFYHAVDVYMPPANIWPHPLCNMIKNATHCFANGSLKNLANKSVLRLYPGVYYFMA